MRPPIELSSRQVSNGSSGLHGSGDAGLVFGLSTGRTLLTGVAGSVGDSFDGSSGSDCAFRRDLMILNILPVVNYI